DGHVTGVQTCALPIYLRDPQVELDLQLELHLGVPQVDAGHLLDQAEAVEHRVAVLVEQLRRAGQAAAGREVGAQRLDELRVARADRKSVVQGKRVAGG